MATKLVGRLWPLTLTLALMAGGCEDAGGEDPTVPLAETDPPVEDPTASQPAPTPSATAEPTATQVAPTPTATAEPTATQAPTPTAAAPTGTPIPPTASEPPDTPTAATATPTATPTPATDADGDGFPAAVDCDDQDSAINPDAIEICAADGQPAVDEDCDNKADDADDSVTGAPTWHPDFDDDGYGSLTAPTLTQCAQPQGYVLAEGDCDDSDPAYHPDAAEDDCADPNDYNCDGSVGYADEDGDGYAACEECDDNSAAVHPGASELCNGTDDDCDTTVDEAVSDPTTVWADGDGDGFGDAESSTELCILDGEALPDGQVTNDGDCDDDAVGTYPGADEVCDSADNDCDGAIDNNPTDPTTWYLDSDDDGFGRDTSAQTQCSAPSPFHTDQGGDCDDLNAAINPDATEVCSPPGVDEDCDTLVDDDDDSLDLDTATQAFDDNDADTFGDASDTGHFCVVPDGHVLRADDCDDDDAAVNPDAPEICDGKDNNCDGEADVGAFGDGPLCAGRHCLDIIEQRPDAADGSYWIDPERDGEPFEAYCDMTTDGGGWTVLEKSPYAEPIGKALYYDLAVNPTLPGDARHRMSRERMQAVLDVAGDVRLDCRGEDFLRFDGADLFTGEGGPDSCQNWAVINYQEASFKGNHHKRREMVTWMTSHQDGCAGAWHIDEHAQQGYAFRPNYPWTGAAISPSSADIFSTDPSTVDGEHECHQADATRFIMARPQEICGSGEDDDGDGLIDEGTLGLTPDNTAVSCQAILDACPTDHAADGFYFIDETGGPSPLEVYCDMNTDGGGWTLVGSFNNYDGAFNWTRFASEADNLSNWRGQNTFGSLDSFREADFKSEAFDRLPANDLLAMDSGGGWASYRGAVHGRVLSNTIASYSSCQSSFLEGVEVRSSDAVVNDYGHFNYYGSDPNNGDRCAFNYQVDGTDSSVIALAHQGCGTAGFGHVGYFNGATHFDRDHYFCLSANSVLNTSTSCGAWYGQTSNHWFNDTLCDYALLFVK